METIELTIPERVKIARERANKTQQECADYLGIHANAYGRKERGETEFTANEIVKLGTLFEQKII